MTSAAVPPSPEAARVSSFGRVFGVLFSPKQTFDSIAKRPTWLVPIVLGCCFFIAVVVVFTQRGGWPSFFEKQNANSSRMQQMSAEDREKTLDAQIKIAPTFGYVEGVVLPFLVALVAAGVFLGVFNAMGVNTSFKTSLAIVSYAWVPWLIHGILSILILFLKDISTVDLQNLVASNPGAFLSDDASKWLTACLSSIDIFAIWTMVLLGIGFSSVNSKKLPFGKAFVTVAGVWIVYVLVKVGLTAAFS
jgi:hypothetical protein